MRASPLNQAEKHFKEGRYRAALLELSEREPADQQLKLLFAEALDETGNPERARELLERIHASARSPQISAAAARGLAAVHFNLGSADLATELLRESLAVAESNGLYDEAAHSALRLFSLQSNLFSPAIAQHSLVLAKKYVLRSGSTILKAELHARVGQAEAQASRYLAAHRHLSLALELLDEQAHYGLLARVHLALASTYALTARNGASTASAREALHAAEQSGSLRLTLLCKANLAQLQLRADDLEAAENSAKDVLAALSSRHPLRVALLETAAACRLELDRHSDSSVELDEFARLMEFSNDSWVSIEAVPTYFRLLMRQGRVSEADDVLVEGIRRSAHRSTQGSVIRLTLLRAETLAESGRIAEAQAELEAARLLWDADCSADIVATSERVMGVLAYKDGARRLSGQHFARAQRVFRSCGYRLEARRTKEARKRTVSSQGSAQRCLVRHAGQREVAAASVFLTRLSAYPDILASELCRAARDLKLGESRVVSAKAPGDLAADCVVVGQDEGVVRAVRFTAGTSLRERQILNGLVEPLRYSVDWRQSVEKAEQLQSFWDSDASPDASFGLFISSEMKSLLKIAQQLARTDLPILILGETGTGKEILAAEIHAASRRSQRVFLPFNVTAISRELIESQLFGSRRGSFTGASQDTKGLLREADGGTVFLDEIGEMALEVQPKLLRFVEHGEIQPVGERPQHVDVRIIAATNASMPDLVRDGRFREDLYHRLRVVPLTVPPLRDRREEIPALTRYFIARHAETNNRPTPPIAPRALECLVAADWPGNVRQLNNELKRVVALLPDDETIDVEHLAPEFHLASSHRTLSFDGPTLNVKLNVDRPLEHIVDEAERAAIDRVMTLCLGNQSEVARRLGITRKGLYLKRRRLGMVAT